MSNTIFKKLLKAKANFDTILKSADNPFYKSKFADLNSIMDAVVPALATEGLLLLQPIEGDKVYTIIVDSDSGEKVASWMSIPAHLTKPQDIGGAVTYFRRYGLQSLLGLAAEDDDGNLASGVDTKKSKPSFVPVATSKPVSDDAGFTAPALKAGDNGFRRPIGGPKVPVIITPQEVIKSTSKVWDDA